VYILDKDLVAVYENPSIVALEWLNEFVFMNDSMVIHALLLALVRLVCNVIVFLLNDDLFLKTYFPVGNSLFVRVVYFLERSFQNFVSKKSDQENESTGCRY
jgi:hypothetical protein